MLNVYYKGMVDELQMILLTSRVNRGTTPYHPRADAAHHGPKRESL